MRLIGILATVAGAVVLAGAGAVAVSSLPDIQRYLKIRSM
jgi:hypothetical protein